MVLLACRVLFVMRCNWITSSSPYLFVSFDENFELEGALLEIETTNLTKQGSVRRTETDTSTTPREMQIYYFKSTITTSTQRMLQDDGKEMKNLTMIFSFGWYYPFLFRVRPCEKRETTLTAFLLFCLHQPQHKNG